MDYQILHDRDDVYLKQIAHIHHESLHHLSFLTLFGENFLFQLYKVVLAQRLGFFAIATEGREVFGFALLSFDNTKLMPAVMKNPWHLMALAIPAMLRHPPIILKMIKTIFYFSGTESATSRIKPEFLAQVTRSGSISKGIGTKVIERFEKEYLRLGIHEYKFAIAQVNAPSVEFFKRRGFEVAHVYDFSGVFWNIYVKKIEDRP